MSHEKKKACIKDKPATSSRNTTFFSPRLIIYLRMPAHAGYGDKRGRNKPIGPGGGTRRLHQMPAACSHALQAWEP